MYEWTLTGKGENIKKEVQSKKKKKKESTAASLLLCVTHKHTYILFENTSITTNSAVNINILGGTQFRVELTGLKLRESHPESDVQV